MVDMSKTLDDTAVGIAESQGGGKFFPHSFHFDEEDIKKFGLEGSQLDEEMQFSGKIRISSISSDEDANGKRSRISLEFTEGGFTGEGTQAKRIFKDT